jgi:hypothetical protein
MMLAPLKVNFPTFFPSLLSPALGGTFFHASSFFCSLLFDVFFLFFFFEDFLSSPLSPLPAMALSLGSSLSWPFSELISAAIATMFSSSGDLAPWTSWPRE